MSSGTDFQSLDSALGAIQRDIPFSKAPYPNYCTTILPECQTQKWSNSPFFQRFFRKKEGVPRTGFSAHPKQEHQNRGSLPTPHKNRSSENIPDILRKSEIKRPPPVCSRRFLRRFPLFFRYFGRKYKKGLEKVRRIL